MLLLQLKLPKLQLRLPELQLKLPKLQLRLPELQPRLPKLQLRLPLTWSYPQFRHLHPRLPSEQRPIFWSKNLLPLPL